MTAPVALITGAARRVGAAIARHVHGAEEHRVVVHYRNSRQAAEDLVDELNAARANSAMALCADLGSVEACAQLVEKTLESFGRLDFLVNNASDFYPTPVGEITPEDWDRLFASNARGPLFLSQAAVPALRQEGGSIVNLVDIHADRPRAEHTVYCMAKAALVMLTRSLAAELGPEIRVNGVAPGAILWAEGEAAEVDRDAVLALTALGRRGEPEDIATAVAYLGLHNLYVTGQILAVDGGRSLNL
ncbi:MAG: pteridine reductase [Xanthomonadales bacterium]|nr:pteridine reductase [Xanthomonadales bacterium]